MSEQEIICTGCPLGCRVTLKFSDNDKIESLIGNQCKEGTKNVTAEFKSQVFSDRSGIRLTGPALGWAKERQVEGRHPSTLMSEHGYSVPGALNISGDTPILLPREGPTMGGYICALTVIYVDQWMMGQIVLGRDTVKFIYCTPDEAKALRIEQNEIFEESSIIH